MNNPVSITRLTLTHKGEQKKITPEQFRGAFTDYIRTNFTENQKKTLPINLAHNKTPEGKPETRYSLIQYKTYGNKLEIIAIANGEEVINAWLSMVFSNNNFTINGKEITFSSSSKNTYHWFPELGKHQLFKINGWRPFGNSFGKNNLGDESSFEKTIWGNIHRMLSDINITFHQKVHINIHEFKQRDNTTKGYDVDWITYDVIFSTNINLPQHIGIGRVVSLGSGKISKTSIL